MAPTMLTDPIEAVQFSASFVVPRNVSVCQFLTKVCGMAMDFVFLSPEYH